MDSAIKYKRAKTPTVVQMDAVECGAVSLSIILQYYGRYVPLEQLRTDCGVSRDGSNVYNLTQAASNYGLEPKAFRKSAEELVSMEFPAIIWWEYNHFLVLEGFSKKKVYLNDPAFGPRTVSYEEFKESYAGLIITLNKTEAFQKGGKPVSLLSILYDRVKNSEQAFLYMFLMGFCLLLPGFAMPAFLLALLEMAQTKQFFVWTSEFLVGIIFVALFTGAVTWVQRYFLTRLNLKLSICSSSKFLGKLFRLPMSFYSQRYSGEINWRFGFNTDTSNMFTDYLTAAAIDFFLIFFYAFVLFFYDFGLAALILGIACLNVLMMWLIYRTRQDTLAKFQQDSAKSVTESVGGLSYIETIKSRGAESDFFSRWAGYYTKRANSTHLVGFQDSILLSGPIFFQFLSIALLLCLGALRILGGQLSMPVLLAMQALMMNFLQPVNRFVGYTQLIQNMKVNLERIDDVLKNDDDPVYISREQSTTEITKLTGLLEFKNVSFRYSPHAPLLIENLSFVLHPGSKIAFVGSTGSGKTTVAKLACGLLIPESGEILYDGIPVNQIRSEIFRNYVSIVDQQILLFNGTVRDNLTLWNRELPEHMMIQAAQDASIHDTIVKHPEGYSMELLEGGANFSGGQRQRIEIARALLYNPSLLIMDEATSALDSHTEKAVIDRIRQRGISVIMIAHRLSTIQDCDEIVVLEHGKVVERGSHEELKKHAGVYLSLIESETVDG